MDANTKGAVAEQAIALAATKLGVPVLRPTSDHCRFDLALDIGKRLWRVQCKWGRLDPDGCVIVVRIGTCWFSPNGYVRTAYSEDEVDLFGVYAGELDRCFLLPASRGVDRHEIRLRLSPARNGQQACINLADKFDFNGAIAQLGERSAGSRKVAGSNPASSTPPDDPTVIGSNPFRDRFDYWLERVAAGEELLVTHRGKPRVRLSPAVARLPIDPQPP
jgi:PD-(D/E)XK endonuclease